MSDYPNSNYSPTPPADNYGAGRQYNAAGQYSGYDGEYHYRRKNHRAAKIIAICLVCVIIAGAAGIGTGILISSLDGLTVSGNASASAPNVVSEGYPVEVQKVDGDELPSGFNIVGSSSDGSTNSSVRYTGDTLSAEDIYANSINSCVGVKTNVATQNIFGQITSSAISGSGFVISEDGYIITNYHVVETADERDLEIKVSFINGDEYTAKIVGSDEDNDIALIKIDAKGLSALPLYSGDDLRVGQTIYAIGNPLGQLTYSMTSGILSALDREIIVESNKSINVFQMDAAINSGSSGGPVLNDRGEVIGIASAKNGNIGVEGICFAIPIKSALNVINDIIDYGYVRGKPYFGITVNTVTESVAQYYNLTVGAFIVEIDPDACAAKAGIETSDIITKIDDYDILSSSDVVSTAKKYKAGDTVHVTVFRDGEYLEFDVTLDEYGAPKSDTQVG